MLKLSSVHFFLRKSTAASQPTLLAAADRCLARCPQDRLNATDSRDNLFAETAQANSRVKFGAPHWVDFGQEMEHSPDGKAYIVGHGARTA